MTTGLGFDEANGLAHRLAVAMVPYCERVQIAGSIRRGKSEVKDLELIAVPRWAERPGADLFGEPVRANLLFEWATGHAPGLGITWIKPGTSEIIEWPVKEHGKYWRGMVTDGTTTVKLDLFLATPENFGILLLIRTGSAEFSQAVVTHGKRIGIPCVDGYLQNADGRIVTEEETDAFAVLGLEWLPPPARTGPEAVRRVRSLVGV